LRADKTVNATSIIPETPMLAWFPWSRREPPPPQAAPFDARREQARLSELVMRRAASWLNSGVEARGASDAQVQDFCAALVAGSSHLRLCWTWFGAADTAEIAPEIVAGPAADYARQLRIPRTLLTSRGPAFRVLDGRPVEPFNVSSASLYPPWREAAAEHGVRSVLALSLTAPDDDRRGLFVLYADIPDYFAQVGVGLFDATAQLIASVLSHATRHAVLERLARTDPLTGLLNRTSARSELETLRRADPQRPLCLMLIDLDHFKLVNDSLGHAAGDAVLVAAARHLQAMLRRQDGVARWGGEEFVVWLPDCRLAEACLVAEKLRAAIAAREHVLDEAHSVRVTASTGLVEPQTGESLDDALARADRAMYTAKQAGRNRVTIG
jgi:diguanylate cyclase (GGDEF)-like protein